MYFFKSLSTFGSAFSLIVKLQLVCSEVKFKIPESKLFFSINKFKSFGHYEDFVSTSDPYINHSIISAPLNIGLITPEQVLNKLSSISYSKVGINNYEGYIRQVFGWREFMRYLNIHY